MKCISTETLALNTFHHFYKIQIFQQPLVDELARSIKFVEQ